MAFTSPQGGDYDNPPPGCALTWATCDDPGPALGALSDGRFGDFVHQQPFLGPLTLVLRAPGVAVVEAAGADVKAQYRWGALLCLLLVGAFGVWLALMAGARGRPFWFQLLIAGGLVLNPVTRTVLRFGHPEEMVTGALAAAALICAVRRRPALAGALLGLAIASKAWAVLALPALLVVLAPQWRRALVAVVIAAGLLIAPMALGDMQRFRDNVTTVGRLGSQFGTLTPTNAVWPLGEVKQVSVNGGPPGRAARLPVGVARAARLLVFAAALLLTIAWLRTGGRNRPESVLLLLALILLVRGLFDPSNHSYYHAGPFVALLAYDSLVRRWFPWATAAFVALFELFTLAAKHLHGLDADNRLYLAWSVPFAIYMAVELLSARNGSRTHIDREARLPASPARV